MLRIYFVAEELMCSEEMFSSTQFVGLLISLIVDINILLLI
jgi:hypothetical protein